MLCCANTIPNCIGDEHMHSDRNDAVVLVVAAGIEHSDRSAGTVVEEPHVVVAVEHGAAGSAEEPVEEELLELELEPEPGLVPVLELGPESVAAYSPDSENNVASLSGNAPYPVLPFPQTASSQLDPKLANAPDARFGALGSFGLRFDRFLGR